VPKLETLQLWHLQDWGTSQNLFTQTAKPPVIILNNYAPSLKNISLVGVNLAWSQSPYVSGLRNLELALHSKSVRPAVKEWETMLRDCPDLERLSLHYSGPRLDDLTPITPIPMLHLSEISLTDVDPDVSCFALRYLVTPSVRSLELELPDQDFSQFADLLADPTEPRFPALERLHVSALECSPDSWFNLLKNFRRVTYLYVDFRRVQFAFYEKLCTKIRYEDQVPPLGALPQNPTSSGDHHDMERKKNPIYSVLLPNLQVFKVAGLESSSLVDFDNFRRHAGYPLDRYIVHKKSREESMDALHALQQLEYYQDSDDEEDEEEDTGLDDELEEEYEEGSEDTEEHEDSIRHDANESIAEDSSTP